MNKVQEVLYSGKKIIVTNNGFEWIFFERGAVPYLENDKFKAKIHTRKLIVALYQLNTRYAVPNNNYEYWVLEAYGESSEPAYCLEKALKNSEEELILGYNPKYGFAASLDSESERITAFGDSIDNSIYYLNDTCIMYKNEPLSLELIIDGK